MRKFLLACLCVVALVVSGYGSEQVDFRPVRTSPAFIWGNNNYLFSGQNVQVLDVASSEDIKNAILKTKIPSVLSPHFTQATSQQPEVFLVFIENELRSDQVPALGDSLKNVKSLVESSASSMSVPYVYNKVNGNIGNDIATALADKFGKVVVATNEDSSKLPASLRRNVVSLTKLMSLASDNSWDLLNNKQMDVVVVLFDSRSSNNNSPTMEPSMLEGVAFDDTYIALLVSHIKSVNYVALFTAQQPAAQVDYYFPSSDPKLARFEEALTQQALGEVCNGCLWPNSVLEGLIVIAPFLIILVIAVSCNYQIQSELKYDAEKPRKY